MEEDFKASQAKSAQLKDSANKLTVSIFMIISFGEAKKGSFVC